MYMYLIDFFHKILDWELTQEELEDAEINHEDWDDEVMPKPGDPMDVYRISGFGKSQRIFSYSTQVFSSLPVEYKLIKIFA